MRIALLLALLGVGCGGELAPDEPRVGEPPVALPGEVDEGQILSPVPVWRGWTYDGPAVLKAAFADAVGWWGDRGRDLGTETGGQIHVVDMTDRPGPYGEWAKVHYLGDDGAEVRIFEGARAATPAELRALMRHELGHVIGLQHSRDPRCLMWEGGIGGGDLCAHEVTLLLR